MTFNQLTDKVMPTLIIAMILASGSAYLELRELSTKVSYIEKSIHAYHEDGYGHIKDKDVVNNK